MQQVWRVYAISAFVACLVAAATAFFTVRLAPPSPAQVSDGGDKAVGPNPKDAAPGKGAPRPDLEVLEQTGTFFLFEGEAGAVGFSMPYAEPPAVEISGDDRKSALVTEITRSGFKWKGVGKPFFMRSELKWTAKGIKATRS